MLRFVSELFNEASEVAVVLGNTIRMLVDVVENIGITKDLEKRHLSSNEWDKVVSQCHQIMEVFVLF